MKPTSLILLFCFVLTYNANAQTETIFGYRGLRLTGAWGMTTVNLSAYDNDFYLYRGGAGGVEFNRSLLVGWGRQELREDVPIEGTTDDFTLRYDGLYLGFSPNSRRAIHPMVNFLVGGGRVRINDNVSDRVLVLQPGAGLEINVLKWFRIGLEAGYRFVGNDDLADLDSEDLSSPYGQINFKFGMSWR